MRKPLTLKSYKLFANNFIWDSILCIWDYIPYTIVYWLWKAISNCVLISTHKNNGISSTALAVIIRRSQKVTSLVGDQLSTFYPESKSAKNQISLCPVGGGERLVTNFQLLVLSPNLLKCNIPYAEGFAENCLSFFDKTVCHPELSWVNTNGPCTVRIRRTINIFPCLYIISRVHIINFWTVSAQVRTFRIWSLLPENDHVTCSWWPLNLVQWTLTYIQLLLGGDGLGKGKWILRFSTYAPFLNFKSKHFKAYICHVEECYNANRSSESDLSVIQWYTMTFGVSSEQYISSIV